jgi:hypothetical protein
MLGVYVTTKFAVVGMFESLRTELAGTNIGVSIFCPGLVRTQIFDTERNRPDSHGKRGAPPAPPPLHPGAPPVDLMGVAMDPIEAGEYVLEGIRRNDLYILSHPEFKATAQQRCELLVQSFSRKPVPAGRGYASATIMPDIYAAELAKKKATAPRKKSKARAKPRAKAKPGLKARAKALLQSVSAKRSARAARRQGRARRR